jgi:tRNA dimethylallyltransferase
LTSINPQQRIYAIAGPTASGKTELGVEIAHRLNGEIINCDSVQIYEDIQIATAKPSVEEMRGIPHHLIGYVSPHIKYSAVNWVADAVEKIAEIESRGKTAILVGGTGFYLRALIQPFFESPKTDQFMREKLESIRQKKGAEHLHKILNRLDKSTAEKLMPRDYVRVFRAIAVYFQTGKPISELQPNRIEAPECSSRIKIFVLNPPRAELYAKINSRAEKHFENGLVEEVISLRNRGLSDETNALGAHGYRRVCEYLRNERSLESAIELTKQDVRNYAKRQLSWFRREENVVWLDGFGDEISTQDLFFENA